MTKLNFLDDTYRFTGTGRITVIGRDERGAYVICDETIVYPKGGGQPSDKATLSTGGISVTVTDAAFVDGAVRHYVGEADAAHFAEGDQVSQAVDGVARLLHARLHTAGHVVSHVIETLAANLAPVKGFHYPEGGYVEFSNPAAMEPGPLMQAANTQLAAAVAGNLPVAARMASGEEVKALRPALAAMVPAGKPTRLVTIGGFTPLPCGGTHVSGVAELVGLRITKAKRQKDNLRMSYEMG